VQPQVEVLIFLNEQFKNYTNYEIKQEIFFNHFIHQTA